MNYVIAEIIICLVIILFLVSCFFDLKVNLTTLRKVKKLEERISVLEEGRESNDNN